MTDSVFDQEDQHQRVDSKIVASLERLNQAFRVLLWEQAQQHGLSPIQIQILVFLLNHDTSLGRVGHLAREFGMTAATVSDAVTALEDKKLLARIVSRQDRRIVNLRLTPAGKKLSNKLSGWADSIRDAVTALPQREQIAALKVMLKLIESLQHAEVVTVARMCTTCKFFGKNVHPGSPAPHYCKLLNKPLAVAELRVDCAEYEGSQ